MFVGVLVSSLLLFTLQPSECADAAACRAAALEAAAKGDFETFHDLAWRAVQKGRRNDPESMTLLARAQSLSGRPGDALVMLRRLAQMGVATDAATHDDFRRVRALAGWPEVEALLKEAAAAPPPAPTAGPEKSSAAAETRTPAPAASIPAERSKTPAKPNPPSAAKSARADTSAPGILIETESEDDELPPALASLRPAGLAYDAVSRRFIIGDRGGNKLVIFDGVFNQATDMTGVSAGFFGVTALEIDHRRGDLWVANSSDRGSALHKLQLVSGRALFDLRVPEELGATWLVDAAVLPDGQVLVLDAAGRRLLGVAAGARAFHRIASADADGLASVAVVNGTAAYAAHSQGLLRIDLGARTSTEVGNSPRGVLRLRADGRTLIAVQTSGGGHRIIRLRLDANGRKVNRLEVLDPAVQLPDPSALTVTRDGVFFINVANGTPAIRRLKRAR